MTNSEEYLIRDQKFVHGKRSSLYADSNLSNVYTSQSGLPAVMNFIYYAPLIIIMLVVSAVRKLRNIGIRNRRKFLTNVATQLSGLRPANDTPLKNKSSSEERNRLRADFPYFDKTENIYLDSAATTHKPLCVINALSEFYLSENSNVHRGSVLHPGSSIATASYEKARKTIAKFIHANNPTGCTEDHSTDGIIITRGSTHAFNMLASAVRIKLSEPTSKTTRDANSQSGFRKGAVVVSEGEHHSNILPWINLGIVFPLKEESNKWQLDMDYFKRLLSPDTRIVTMVHSSHVFGSPLADISIVKNMMSNICPKALLVLDCSQSGLHADVDVLEIPADVFVFSGHKLLGPTGVGFMWMNGKARELLGCPGYLGGGAVDSVWIDYSEWPNSLIHTSQENSSERILEYGSRIEYKPADWPFRWEPGTPPIAEAVGLAKALEYIQSNRAEIKRREWILLDILLTKLRLSISCLNNIIKIPTELSLTAGCDYVEPQQLREIRLLESTFPRSSPIVSVDTGPLNSADVAALMAIDCKACVRSGHHCAMPLHSRLGIESMGSLRFSIGPYNTEDEINRVVECFHRSMRTLLDFKEPSGASSV